MYTISVINKVRYAWTQIISIGGSIVNNVFVLSNKPVQHTREISAQIWPNKKLYV